MPVRILEVTVRDGSYEVGFQFTLEDVAIICETLDLAGFSLIEVAHGNGLGGDILEPAAASDEDYLATARRAVKKGKLGAVVAFMKREDIALDKIRLAADNGLDFLRFAFVPSRSRDRIVTECVGLAKKLGLTVSINYMRTYCATPDEIGERSRSLLDLGVDWFYIVDSAGGMLPGEVKTYVEALRASGAADVGYHGHNNTQMAVSNSLAAMEAGATLLDASLQGLGRATGNAPTEVLLAILQARYGHETHIDRRMVHALGQRLIRPWVQAGFDPTHILSGVYNLHSSFLGHLQREADKHQVAMADLLPVVGRLGADQLHKKTFTDEFVAAACADLRRTSAAAESEVGAATHREPAALSTPLELMAGLKVFSLRDHLRAALALVPRVLWPFDDPQIIRRDGWAFGVVPVGDDSAETWREVPPDECIVRTFVAHEARAALDVAPVVAGATPFRFADALAEAALAGIDDLVAPVLVAVEDQELRDAIFGRMRGYREVTEASRVGAAKLTGHRHVIAQGTELERLFAEPEFLQALSADMTIALLGRHPIPAAAMPRLRAAGCRIRVPDVVSLLIARAIRRDEVRLVDSPDDARRALLDDRAELVAWRADVIDAADGRHLGSMSTLAGKGEAPRAAGEATRLASLVRASRLLR